MKISKEVREKIARDYAEKVARRVIKDNSVMMYNEGLIDGIKLVLAHMGHSVEMKEDGGWEVKDLFDADDYELTNEESRMANGMNVKDGFGFDKAQMEKYVRVCRLCDIGDFDKAYEIFSSDKELLPKSIVEAKSTKGIKAYIVERLEDANFHSEACLIEGYCYSGVSKILENW